MNTLPKERVGFSTDIHAQAACIVCVSGAGARLAIFFLQPIQRVLAQDMTKMAPEDNEMPSLTGSPPSVSSEELVDFDHELDLLDGWTAADFVSENDFDMIDMLSAALEQVTHQLNEKQREFRARSTEWTAKTKDRLRLQTVRLEDRRARIQERLLKHYDALNDRMNRDAKTVRLRDKISFVVGVGNACVTPALAARLPEWIPVYYTIQSVYLLSLRYLIYKVKKWHYFIFDLCYFVNALTLLYLWCFRSSTPLFFAAFCLTNGPVAWAIITWYVDYSSLYHDLTCFLGATLWCSIRSIKLPRFSSIYSLPLSPIPSDGYQSSNRPLAIKRLQLTAMPPFLPLSTVQACRFGIAWCIPPLLI